MAAWLALVVATFAAPAALAAEFPTEDPIVLSGDLHDRTQIVFGWRIRTSTTAAGR